MFLRLYSYSALALLLFGLTWLITERNTSSPEDLTTVSETYSGPCMNYWTTDPAFTDTMSLQAQAMRLYDKREYALALEAFQRFEPTIEEEGLYNLYLGICYLKCDFANLAISSLNSATETCKKFELVQMSKWYLALSHLKAGEEKEAIERLKQLVEANAAQRYQADEILKKLQSGENPIQKLLAAAVKPA